MIHSLLNYPEFAMYIFAQMSEQEIEDFFWDNNPIKIPPKEPSYKKITEIRVNNNSDVPICFRLMDKVDIYTSIVSEHYVGPKGFFTYTALPQDKFILNGMPEVICNFAQQQIKVVDWSVGVEEHMGPLMRRGIYTYSNPNKLIPMVEGIFGGWIMP